MAPKVMLFAGPPAPATVNEESCTITRLDPQIEHFLGLTSPSPGQNDENKASQGIKFASWRSLSLHQRPPQTGFSQVHQTNHTSAAFDAGYFFTTADVSAQSQGNTLSLEEAEDVLTQFCEQSLAAHNSLPSSQLDGEVSDPSVTSVEESSLYMTSGSTSRSGIAPHPPAATPCHLSDLEDIPPPKDIIAAIPSTITVNLIVGIISIAQPRTVTTRWGRQLSLVEVLVGDDTKSGFAITFWLSSDSISQSQISNFRRQDVVLMRNVALHAFRDKVYGQSLRKGLTQVILLWRRDGSGLYSNRVLSRKAEGNPQIEKVSKTKEWVLHFVGVDQRAETGKKNPRKSWDQPPEDTQ